MCRRQEVHREGNGRLELSVSCSRRPSSKKGEALIESLDELFDREYLRASRCKLDGQGQSVQPRNEFEDVRLGYLPGLLASAKQEETAGIRGVEPRDLEGARQRGVDAPVRGQHDAGAEVPCEHRVDLGPHAISVVEDDGAAHAAQKVDERRRRIECPWSSLVQQRREVLRGLGVRRIAQEQRACVGCLPCRERLTKQRTLARARRTEEAHDPGPLAQEVREFSELGVATNQRHGLGNFLRHAGEKISHSITEGAVHGEEHVLR